MSTPFKVLFADDSTVMRKILTEAFSRAPQLEVLAQAQNGQEAVDLLQKVDPDVVVLDVEMPVLDGVETVVAIRKLNPRLPIVMFSSITTRGAEATLDALYAGANDYVTKPSRVGKLEEAMELVRLGLIPRVCEWALRYRNGRVSKPNHKPASMGIGMPPTGAQSSAAAPGSVPAPGNLPSPSSSASTSSSTKNVARTQQVKEYPAPTEQVRVVTLGVSTGGPNALSELLRDIPQRFPVPVLIVQHMPPMYTQLLAERLDANCPLKVREGVHGAKIGPGQVWIAPGGRHMTVARVGADYHLELNDHPPENSCRPAVDVLFRSAAQVFGGATLGVVMTGMGKDGLEGARLIREQRGRVLVQDQSTSVVWGMPRAVFEAGLAHKSVPLNKLAEEMTQLALRSGAAQAPLIA